MTMDAYTQYEADLDASAAAEARQDMLEARADADRDTDRNIPDRVLTLQARVCHAADEAERLAAELDGHAWEVRIANHDAELWMRAIEGAFQQARDAMKYLRKASLGEAA
jgi:cytochrome c5